MRNTTQNDSGNLAPLADILSRPFHIDISSEAPLLVTTASDNEYPLSMLSTFELEDVRDKACGQYVESVLSSNESIDQDRATLFFISRYCVSRGNLESAARSIAPKPRKSVRNSRSKSTSRRPPKAPQLQLAS